MEAGGTGAWNVILDPTIVETIGSRAKFDALRVWPVRGGSR